MKHLRIKRISFFVYFLIIMVAVVGLLAPSSAHAATVGIFADNFNGNNTLFGFASVDGETQDFPILYDGNMFSTPDMTLFFGGGIVTLGTNGNFDPIISLSFTVIDLATPSNFAVAITAPVIPTISGLGTFRFYHQRTPHRCRHRRDKCNTLTIDDDWSGNYRSFRRT